MLDPVHPPHGFRVLFVEDDVRLARLTAEFLESQGLLVTHVADGEAGLREAAGTSFDVVVLDWMLPKKDGLAVCEALRQRSDVPILFLTARGEEVDRVLGLRLGADDYLTKPFSTRELLARLEALVRRARGQAGPSREVLQQGPLTLDPGALEARWDGAPLPLTAYEFSLLRALAQNAGRILGRERLMELAGADTERAFDRSIDVHVSRLRQKLGPQGRHALKTVRGAGYLFSLDEER